jgi:hypothetical protein
VELPRKLWQEGRRDGLDQVGQKPIERQAFKALRRLGQRREARIECDHVGSEAVRHRRSLRR